jgi:enolase-phosphatase E1
LRFVLEEHQIRAIVLDIEGTTTPLAFVHDVLFPYARTHLRASLDTLGSDVLREPVRRLQGEWLTDAAGDDRPREPRTNDELVTYVGWLMDRDRKSPGLKLLQGLIWQRGYQSGELVGFVFDDVAEALRRWHATRTAVAIYSSGSRLAQRLLFSHTPHGDLTPLISSFFDTEVGPKAEADSYRRIAHELRQPASALLFISDTTAELDAAARTGCQVLLCERPGNRPQPHGRVPAIASFDEIG